MKTQAKTWIIISGVFLLGIIIGILGSHLFFRYQVSRIMTYRSPQRIFQFVERVVTPSPEQRPGLEKILLKHGNLLFQQMRENQERQLQRLSELKSDLAKILRPDQMNRLEQYLQRRSLRKRPGRERRRGPEPPLLPPPGEM